ncbi:hypothetical protein ABE494_21470 [Stenotrophomonas lactitubi]|uniref:hypothetical protein n=1 Tax=Stenotrophomonas lactitubi TaxID=2045214 RepID=UPI00320789F4
MYALTEDKDVVVYLETGASIPRGHRWWTDYEQWLEEGNTPLALPPPSREELIQRTKALIGHLLDTTVMARGYDGIVSCVSYVGDDNPAFDAEARAARSWRSAVYTAGYAILANTPDDVTTPEQVLERLPTAQTFGWPE